MNAVAAFSVVLQKQLKRPAHGREREFGPGNVAERKKAGFQRFFTCAEIFAGQRGPVEHVYLVYVGYMDDGVELSHGDGGQRFLKGLTGSRLKRGFGILHEPGRQGPEPVPGFDRPAAKQYLVIHHRNGTGDNSRILVMYSLAIDTDVAVTIVALRNALLDVITTGTAVFHSGHRKMDKCVVENATIRAAGVAFKNLI